MNKSHQCNEKVKLEKCYIPERKCLKEKAIFTERFCNVRKTKKVTIVTFKQLTR